MITLMLAPEGDAFMNAFAVATGQEPAGSKGVTPAWCHAAVTCGWQAMPR